MLNPISVSYIKNVQTPQVSQFSTNPFKMGGLSVDTFQKSTAISNISFTSVDDTVVGKTIRELGDVRDPYCGTRLINGKEISHLTNDNLGGTSEQALKLLKPFEDRMHPVEKQVFNILEGLSKKEPKKNLRELLDTIRPQHLQNLMDNEYGTLAKMADYTKKNVKDKEDNEKLSKLLTEANSIIDKQDANYIFRRRRFMEKLDGIKATMKDQKVAAELQAIADKLPAGHDSVDAFVIKFSQKDPKTKNEKTAYQIGISLVEPSVGSLEHIHPRHPLDGSKGGTNKYSNYIYASREWNTKRKNMPLDKWVEKNPEIKTYMQQYMDDVIDKINSGKAMQNCKVYPIIVAESLKKESNNLIQLDTSKLKLSQKEIKSGLAKIKKEEAKIDAKANSKKPKTSSKTLDEIIKEKTTKSGKTTKTKSKAMSLVA